MLDYYKKKGAEGKLTVDELKEYKRLLYHGVPLYDERGVSGNGIGFYPRDYRLDYYKNLLHQAENTDIDLGNCKRFREIIKERNDKVRKIYKPQIKKLKEKIVLFTDLLI